MSEPHSLEDEINRLLPSIDESQASQDETSTPEEGTELLQTEPEPERTETIHVYVVREGEEEEPLDQRVVDTTLTEPEDQQLSSSTVSNPGFLFTAEYRRRKFLGLLTAGVSVLLLLTSIAFQVLLALLTPPPTIILVPVMRDLSTTATITSVAGTPTGEQIPGRLLPPLTLSQTKIALATGKGHQDDRHARGTITFYNGLFTPQTVVAGTKLTGSDGVQVATDHVAVIPAALATTPPTYGQVTVSAHATQAGSQGNIHVRDINQTCCLPSVLAQNTAEFQGGQNERDYTIVTQANIDHVVPGLATTLMQSERAAVTAQLMPGETFVTPTCATSVTADQQPGEETRTVSVTVSEHCTTVAYESVALQDRATQILIMIARQQLGTHYSLIGAIQVSVLRALIIDQKWGRASIAVDIDGTWMYQFSQQELQWIKQLIAGKTQQQAIHVLLGLSGIQRATIEGIGENQRLPKERSRIQICILYGEVSSAISNRHWLLEL